MGYLYERNLYEPHGVAFRVYSKGATIFNFHFYSSIAKQNKTNSTNAKNHLTQRLSNFWQLNVVP